MKQIFYPVTLSACALSLLLAGCNNGSNHGSSHGPNTPKTLINFDGTNSLELTNGVAPASQTNLLQSSVSSCDQKDVRDDLVCKTIYVNYQGDTAPQVTVDNQTDFQLGPVQTCASSSKVKGLNCQKYQLSFIPKSTADASLPYVKTNLIASIDSDSSTLAVTARVPYKVFYKKSQSTNYKFDYIDRLDSQNVPLKTTNISPDGYEYNKIQYIDDQAMPAEVVPHAGWLSQADAFERGVIDISTSNHFGNYFAPGANNINSYFADPSHQAISSIEYRFAPDAQKDGDGLRYTPLKFVLTHDFIVATNKDNVYSLAAMALDKKMIPLHDEAQVSLNPIAVLGTTQQDSISDLSLYDGSELDAKWDESSGAMLFKDQSNFYVTHNFMKNTSPPFDHWTHELDADGSLKNLIATSAVSNQIRTQYNFYLFRTTGDKYALYEFYVGAYILGTKHKLELVNQHNPLISPTQFVLAHPSTDFDLMDMAIYDASDNSVNFYSVNSSGQAATFKSKLSHVYKSTPVKFSWHSYNDSIANTGDKTVTTVFMAGVAQDGTSLALVDPSEPGKKYTIPSSVFSGANTLTNIQPKSFACSDEDLNNPGSGFSTKQSIAPVCYMTGWDSAAGQAKVYRITGFDPNKLAELDKAATNINITSAILPKQSDIDASSKFIIDGDTGALAVLPKSGSDHIYHYKIKDDTPNAADFAYNSVVSIKAPEQGETFTGLYYH